MEKGKETIKTINDIIGCGSAQSYHNDGVLLRQFYNSLIKNSKKLNDVDEANILHAYLTRHYIIGDIEAETGSMFFEYIKMCNQLDEGLAVEDRRPIILSIDSDGGDLESTFSIIDAINMSKTPVYTYVTGNAYSGGFFITICGHKRFATPNARLMFHLGSTSVGGVFSGIDAHKFRNYADFYDRELAKLRYIVLNKTNLSEEFYNSIEKDDYWVMAEDALHQGMVDKIVTSFDEVM